MRKTIIGIMGPGEATQTELALAGELGRLIAENGWTLLTGGRSAGVMAAASEAAKKAGGQTIGILPFKDFDEKTVSPWVDFAIFTGMGDARNVINVLSSDVVLVCGMGSGTASEVALALKSKKRVVLVAPSQDSEKFFTSLEGSIRVAEHAQQAVEIVKSLLSSR